jgi:hypothetical protein
LREITSHGYVLSAPIGVDAPIVAISSAKLATNTKPINLSLVDATSWSYATKDKQESTDKTETSGLPSATKLDYKAIGNQGNQIDVNRPLSATSSKVGQHNLKITKASSGASTVNVSYPLLPTYTTLKTSTVVKFLELPQTWQITSINISIGQSNSVDLTLTAPTMDALKLPERVAPTIAPTTTPKQIEGETFDNLTGVTTTNQPTELKLDEPSIIVKNEPGKLTLTTLSNDPTTITVFNPTNITDLTKIDPQQLIAKGLKFLVVSSNGYYVPLSKVLANLPITQ